MRNKTLKSLKVLLVEDEEKLSSLLKSAIGDSFYSFAISNNGEEGLEKFIQMQPDIIITDIMMPKMTGLEMSAEIRKISKDIPIIILSAYSEPEKLLNAIDVGVVKYFIKPFDPDELLEYISTLAQSFESKTVELKEGFSFNSTTNSLYKNSRYVSLSKNENKLIKFLIENYVQDRMVEDKVIKNIVWENEEVSDERLRTFIRRLRVKTSKELLLNVKGRGYQIAHIKNL